MKQFFNAGSDKRQHYKTISSHSPDDVPQFGGIFEHRTKKLASMKLVWLANLVNFDTDYITDSLTKAALKVILRFKSDNTWTN